MLTNVLFSNLFNKTATSLHHSLYSLAEAPAGLSHRVCGEGAHQLGDLCLQGRQYIVLWGVLLTSCSKTHHRTAVWAAGRPDLLGPSLSQRKSIFRDITWNVAGKTWYYAEYFMKYHVFCYISCYSAEIWITFRTGQDVVRSFILLEHEMHLKEYR